MSKQTLVIVGASMAGAKAAEELRARGFEGRVLLVGAEPERPYERPPLTKDYLRDESERAKTYVHEERFYEEQQIELLTGVTATAIDTASSRLSLDGGRELAYDRLLLATGSEPRRITIPGAELDGVHELRTLADCDALRRRLARGGRAVVVGAGWIGSEFAASARQRGLKVTLVGSSRLPNERIFGAELGAFYRDLHARNGVELVLADAVEAFEGSGTVERVRTASGRLIECDFVVVGIGATPRVKLALDAGLDVDNGIVVDQGLKTSVPNIFAAGDVARAWHPFYNHRLRVEHWANALTQGPAAARAMLGESVSYDHIPYFFSDQYDVGMEYSGYAPEWDEVVFRGDPAGGEFVAFWIREGRIAAGMNVNVWDVNAQVQALIRSRRTIDLAALKDPAIPLDALVGEPVAEL